MKSVTDHCGILQVLQGQVSNHQIAVEKLKKAAEVLLDTRRELTQDKDEIQKTLGKMFTFLNTSFYRLWLHAGTERDKIQFPHFCVTVQVHVLLNHKLLQHSNFIVFLSRMLIHMLFT